MGDTPRVPLQGNIILSPTAPVVLKRGDTLQGNVRLSPTAPVVLKSDVWNSPEFITVIAMADDPIIVMDEAIADLPFVDYNCVQFTHDTSLASGPQIVTGVGFKPSLILFQTGLPGGSPWGSLGQAQASDLGGQFSIEIGFFYNSIFSQPGLAGIQRTDAAGSNYAYFNVTSVDADGFTISWAKIGSATALASVNAACFR